MIGGEFDLDIFTLEKKTGDATKNKKISYFSSGRAALYHILKYLKEERDIHSVLLPDFLCSSITNTIDRCGISYQFYSLSHALDIDYASFQNIYQSDIAIVLINYFGMTDIASQIKEIRKIDKNAIIVEDDVQAYYSFVHEEHDVAFKFTSLRKAFPIPDGSLVKGIAKLSEPKNENTFTQYKVAGSILKTMRDHRIYGDEVYLNLFEKGENLIDDNLDSRMSDISLRLLNQLDLDREMILRRRNADFLINGLNELGIRPLLTPSSQQMPLFIPICLANRDEVRRKMFKEHIFCPIHWPLDGLSVECGRYMAEHELSLIIDQRYGLDDMRKQLTIIKEVLNN